MLRADLHVHTTHSDGKLTPSEMIATAAACGLSTLSITDHDTFSGYLEARPAADSFGISLIPGIELTTVYKGRECHLLGYGFDPKNDGIHQIVRNQKDSRINRTEIIFSRLENLGISISSDEIPVQGKKTPGRPQIAALLHQKGIVKSTKEAFDRFLGESAPAYVPLLQLRIEQAISALHMAGGVAVLAHPGYHFSLDDLEFLKAQGMDGVEFLHPAHNFILQKRYQDWASINGLVATGGSDFHGFSSRDRQFLGTVAIDIAYVARLRQRISSKRTTQPI